MEEPPPNLLSIRWVPYNLMREMYLKHHTFRKWLTHPATPYGKMEIEAKLCGLTSYLNDKEIIHIPHNMLDYNAIPELKEIFEDVMANKQ